MKNLRILVVNVERPEPSEELLSLIRKVGGAEAELIPANPEEIITGRWSEGVDLVVLFGLCGSTPLAASLAQKRLPALPLTPQLCFHPYQATFYHQMEQLSGVVLPAENPTEISASLEAVRAQKRVKNTRLLVVDDHTDDFRAAEIQEFGANLRQRLGVEIVHRTAAELKELAACYSDQKAEKTLSGWFGQVVEGPGEINHDYLLQTAKLYLAEKELLTQTKAVGITVDDIGAFLKKKEVMPNISYGPLVFEGYLAAEEADIEVLASELILKACLGTHPTMSNIYLAYRDSFDILDSAAAYTLEAERADFFQCLLDNHLTAAHFSTSGVLPPEMMVEKTYRLRETLPSWPGQGMIAATPRLGPVVLLRLSSKANATHFEAGTIDRLGFGDQYGWYRGRYFIKIPSVASFIKNMLHQHYAVGPENGQLLALQILLSRLSGFTIPD